MFRPVFALLTSLACVAYGWGFPTASLFAQQLVEKEALVKKTQKVQAVDEDGKPIPGVVIKPFGLNTSYFWPENLMGKPARFQTDHDGFVTLEYPELFADGVKCKSIDCTLVHSEHVGAVARIPIQEETQKITLKKGVRFSLKAIDVNGDAVKERFAAMMSGETTALFQQIGTDGLIETKGASIGPHQVMLVQPSKDNKTKFSEALFFHLSDRDQELGVVVDDVELYPGVRVFGKLPATIPRPVKEGYVIARQQPLPMKEAQEALGGRQLMWGEWSTIAEDGSFEFVSMPRTGKIQVIALCDGWVSRGEGLTTKGQSFAVSEEDLEVELELTRTMDGTVEVKDEAGNPVPDATVSFWPNQLWEDFGSQILGQRWRSLGEVIAQIEQDENRIGPRLSNAYTGKTDSNGRVVVRNLPAYSAMPFEVQKKGFEMAQSKLPPADAADSRAAGIDSGLTSQIEIKLKKSESP